MPTIMLTHMGNGSIGQLAGNTFPAPLGIHRYIGDNVRFMVSFSEGNEREVADNAAVLLPQVAVERQGRALGCTSVQDERAGSCRDVTEVAKIVSALIIHLLGESGLDQVSDRWQVALDFNWPDSWVCLAFIHAINFTLSLKNGVNLAPGSIKAAQNNANYYG